MKDILRTLGLARRAGKLALGRMAAEREIKRGKLLILAKDLSPREKERWRFYSRRYNIRLYEIADKRTLGEALGVRPVGVLLVLDRGFSRKLEELIGKLKVQENSSR